MNSTFINLWSLFKEFNVSLEGNFSFRLYLLPSVPNSDKLFNPAFNENNF